MTDKTTISVTTDTKSELNSLGYKDEDYDTIIKRNINFAKRFYNEYDLHEWFKHNFRLFGFDEVIKDSHSGYPDFIVKKGDKKIGIELEIYSSNFIRHKHDPKYVDLVICLLKDKELTVNTIELSLFEYVTIEKNIIAANVHSETMSLFKAYKKLIPRMNGNNNGKVVTNEEVMKYLIENNPLSETVKEYVKSMDEFLENIAKEIKEKELI